MKGIIRILQSLMGGDHKNITEPYGGGIIRILQSLMGGGIIRILQNLIGGDHKNITEPYGISGKFHRTQPKTSDLPPGDKL